MCNPNRFGKIVVHLFEAIFFYFIIIMKQLNDYFRLKEIDRIEAEKKCLINLKKVIDICIKRDYNFSIHQSEGNSNIYLTTDGHVTSISSYFKGSLINYSDETGTMTMIQLLEKLKKL